MEKETLLTIEKRAFLNMIPEIESNNDVKILLAYVRGSHMYGTATEKSDVDITFVYQQKTDEILKGDFIPQIHIDGDDVVGYEIGRFLELLGNNNPNILESLDIPDDCLIHKHEFMDVFKQEDWLSKLTEKTILGYAQSQIKKATGLNKNMNNAQPKERKSILEFCYVVSDGTTQPFLEFMKDYKLEYNNIDPKFTDYNNWGLVKMGNGKQIYALYPNEKGDSLRGLVKEDSVNLRLSEISPIKNREVYTFIYNIDGFEVHCKQHKSYWEWVENRNEERHLTNSAHGKNYDSKSMMHLFRLLDMAFHIGFTGKLRTRTPDVEFLREIRAGELEYDSLIEDADNLKEMIKNLFELSDLQDKPAIEKTKELILKFRKNEFSTSK